MLQVVFGDLKLIEEFKLFQGAELGNFGGTDFIEDDLKHADTLTEIRPDSNPAKQKRDDYLIEQYVSRRDIKGL